MVASSIHNAYDIIHQHNNQNLKNIEIGLVFFDEMYYHYVYINHSNIDCIKFCDN